MSRDASPLRVVALSALALALGGVLPVGAGAALPDGRVYEQASPANKSGNDVLSKFPAHASSDGNAVVYMGTGAIGAASTGKAFPDVSRRSSSGWATSTAVPGEQGDVNSFGGVRALVPSQDLSSFVFTGSRVGRPFISSPTSVPLFLTNNPMVEPLWLARPTIEHPIPAAGSNANDYDNMVAGVTPTLSTVYFAYSGTLLPQDASRAPNVGLGMAGEGEQQPGESHGYAGDTRPWGFYEWTGGVLAEAGVLPNGSPNPFGAVPVAFADLPGKQRVEEAERSANVSNQVSEDGSRAFFVSPDPTSSTVTDAERCAEVGPCTSAPPELYVRETAPDGSKSTVLVSQSQLPGQAGQPAPSGVAGALSGNQVTVPFAYASPDGSNVFFLSTDRLTSAAPSGGAPKEYDFNLNTGVLTYMPNVAGRIVVSSRDGLRVLFEAIGSKSSPAELELWSAGENGGHTTPIVQVPGGGVDGRSSTDGSVFAFMSNAPISGFNHGGFAQIYRYEVSTGVVSCVSCPPAGIMPSGNANWSYDKTGGSSFVEGTLVNGPISITDTRALSSDGARIFFDTPDPLVSEDSNGRQDVYEWEAGSVHLISSGVSPDGSYFADASASGGDVFFTTTQGLSQGDTDGGTDVYDARIPHPGDNPPPAAVPCAGEVCQGPPSVPNLLGVPASATFNGLGDIPAQPAAPGTKAKSRHKAKAKRTRRRHRAKRAGKAGRSSKRITHGKGGRR